MPKELLPSQASCALESLYQNTGGKSIDGANAARADVPALWDVLMKLSCSSDQMVKHRITLNSALEKDKKIAERLDREKVLRPQLCDTDVITQYMAKNIAASCLSYEHLRLTFSRDCYSGLALLLREKRTDGKPRVTARKKIADALKAHFFAKASS